MVLTIKNFLMCFYCYADTFKLLVDYGKTYLLRMINAGMNNILFFGITNHTFTVVGHDAAYSKPFKSDYITIGPGQTLDVLLKANQHPNLYYMAAKVFAGGGRAPYATPPPQLYLNIEALIPHLRHHLRLFSQMSQIQLHHKVLAEVLEV